jgi:glucosamine kinase
MGFLLAESGSSKTEWRLCVNGEIVQSLRSPGFNPNVQTPAAMLAVFQDVIQQVGYDKVSKVCFYGAGLAELSQRKLMSSLLKDLLPETEIVIEHDMLAAVRSTLRKSGIVCILGTGSNSARYEGDTIIENLGGHGYLFGDEGSGANIGKMMIKAMLQDDVPKEAIAFFEEREQSTIHEIKIAVMRAEKPNVKLATFAKMTGELFAEMPSEQVKAILTQNFYNFLDTTVCRYSDYKEVYTDFVGSVAYYFQPMLQEACENRGVKMGNIYQNPVETLIQYHLKG